MIRDMFKKTYTRIDTRYRAQKGEPSIPEGLWRKCNKCGQPIYVEDVKSNYYVCPKCGGYFRMHAYRRIEMLVDEGTFEEWNQHMEFSNPLDFPGYEKKVQAAREKTNLDEAIVTGKGNIGGYPAVIGVCDARFYPLSPLPPRTIPQFFFLQTPNIHEVIRFSQTESAFLSTAHRKPLFTDAPLHTRGKDGEHRSRCTGFRRTASAEPGPLGVGHRDYCETRRASFTHPRQDSLRSSFAVPFDPFRVGISCVRCLGIRLRSSRGARVCHLKHPSTPPES